MSRGLFLGEYVVSIITLSLACLSKPPGHFAGSINANMPGDSPAGVTKVYQLSYDPGYMILI